MPKFLYSVTLVSVVTLIGCIKILITKTPDSSGILVLFLTLFGLWFFSTSSLITFFVNKRKTSDFYNPRLVYRKGLKHSLMLSLGITGFLGLKIFGVLNVMTGSLFVLFFTAILATNASKKR